MVLALHNEVALMNGNAATAIDPFIRNGDILFGRVVADPSVGTVVDVLWENGILIEAVACAATGPFDKITNVSNVLAAQYQGRVVFPLSVGSGNIQSPEYHCLVVRLYIRQLNGAGETTTYALLRNLHTGQMFETGLDNVTLISGQ